MPSLPPHRDDEVPAGGRLRVDHQVVHDPDADVARRVVTERVDVGRQIEIIVEIVFGTWTTMRSEPLDVSA